MKIYEEFKTFIKKGNIVDLAIAFILGGAFGRVVSSLVNDIIMPPLGMAIGGVDFSNLRIVLKKAVTTETGQTVEAITINYGVFIQTIVVFLILALILFFLVRTTNKLKRKEEAKQAPPPGPSPEVQLLTEIRDLLKK